jgi:hypothetical protein
MIYLMNSEFNRTQNETLWPNSGLYRYLLGGTEEDHETFNGCRIWSLTLHSAVCVLKIVSC